MKRLTHILQWLTGGLWMVSGAVKANDPRGLAYKMEEFFELWSGGLAGAAQGVRGVLQPALEGLHAFSLPLSLLLITLELLLGAALITGRAPKSVVRVSLALMIFFTLLTGYAYLSGKFTNCGCFGDCLPISPLASFGKDLVLLAALFFLLFRTGHLYRMRRAWPVFAAALLFTALQGYALLFLPPVDCLPFKKGASIPEGMKAPPGARPDSFAIRFIYEKGGKRFEFAPEELPADFGTYTYIDRVDKLVRPGNAIPPIRGFALRGLSGADSTEAVLRADEVLLIFALQDEAVKEGKEKLEPLFTGKTPVLLVAPQAPSTMLQYLQDAGINGIPPFSCDNTVIKTVARAPLTALLLQKGRIVRKWSL